MAGCDGTDDECAVDPKCAGKAELNKWLQGKKIALTVIDN